MCPQDVQYSDIDYMERQLDFTLSPNFTGFPALITRMKKDGMRVILILVSPEEGAKRLFRKAHGLCVENFVRIVFPSLLWVEKLRFKKKIVFARVHRSSTVHMEARAFPFEECLFVFSYPKSLSGFGFLT